MLDREEVEAFILGSFSTSTNNVGQIRVPVSPVDRFTAEHAAACIAVGE